jgi:arabinofuranan 3-O-arabinosyltransferase
VVQHQTPANLTVTLPRPSEVAALRVTPSSSTLPAHPTLIAVDLGDGPQVRRLAGDGGMQTLRLRPRITDTIKVSILNWDDVIDRTALGFDQLKPPGLAEVMALDAHGVPVAPADAAANRNRPVALPCGQGPIIGVAGQFVQTSLTTTVGALLDGVPIAAQPCRSGPINLPAGQQELLISPGPAFVVDGVLLAAPQAGEIGFAAKLSVKTGRWSADHREVDVPPSPASRLLVVPESANVGWSARTADGTRLTPITVNGWQQGWVVPAGTGGVVTLEFASNTPYRIGLFGGLALLPLLLLLAVLPVRRPRAPGEPARPWRPAPVVSAVGTVAAGALISGMAGVLVVLAAVATRYLLRNRQRLCEAVTVAVSAGGLIVAGAVLSQYPWRSVDGYIGHSPGVQLLALLSIGMVAASAIPLSEKPAQIQPDSAGSGRSIPEDQSATGVPTWTGSR